MGFSSYTIENQNPNKAVVVVAGYRGPVPIEYGRSHRFEPGAGYNVASEGKVLFDVDLPGPEGPLILKPRDPFDSQEFKVSVTVETQ